MDIDNKLFDYNKFIKNKNIYDNIYDLFNNKHLKDGYYNLYDNQEDKNYKITFIDNQLKYDNNIIDNIFDYIVDSNDFNKYKLVYIEVSFLNNNNNDYIKVLNNHLNDFIKNKLYNISYNLRYINNYIDIITNICENKNDYTKNKFYTANEDVLQINDLPYNILINNDENIKNIYNYYIKYRQNYYIFIKNIIKLKNYIGLLYIKLKNI